MKLLFRPTLLSVAVAIASRELSKADILAGDINFRGTRTNLSHDFLSTMTAPKLS
jgi:hypothetical protein